MDVATNAERTDEDKTPVGLQRLCLQERQCEAKRSLGVDATELLLVLSPCGTGSVDDRTEGSMFFQVLRQLLLQSFVVAEVEFNEADARVGEVAARTGAAHGSPHFTPLFQGMFHEETANEAGSARHEQWRIRMIFLLFHFLKIRIPVCKVRVPADRRSRSAGKPWRRHSVGAREPGLRG